MVIQVFRLNFRLRTGFRVGGGQEVGDNVIRQLRIGVEGVMIPASSWKGMFRRVSEIVLNSEDHFEEHSKKEVDTRTINALLKSDEKFRRIAISKVGKEVITQNGINVDKLDSESLSDLRRIYNEYNCPIERLYGSNYFAGGITISDSVIPNASIMERTHVTIERKSKKASEKHLFSEEIIDAEKIEVKVIVRNEFELWKNSLKLLREIGYFIGGSKSRGIGYIVLDEKESEYAVINNFSETPKFSELKRYLS
ncbi:hypothetical protein HFC64_02195 [Saccharolobus solfataricus]|uniref:CRISPR type III-associated protein domain-containing protein n=2 Tax=Saccharolobus solfataricus TaxID=2287 RepID=Q97YA0_SACS2|nr:RAMP superfamily CRISPR-associated protein [Saccharolobus solfataricus]AAK41666.1 Hypothetical protein SSO1432 [Saccharolobus solfataricus P2]QPG48914.1 hypothetical protein HFC64_02195 [Saccharolobus solfataricus]8BMW_N Chain N, CRISPR-associated Cas7 paralog (Type III-D) [Saccharolobus solfataricus]SAI85110.1 CRISPR-associated Cas7 paralog (Type III-D) [Saccharolobus solfataricus]